MKTRASGWGGFLLRMTLATAILVALCWLGFGLLPFQHLRLALIALFVFSVACGAFVPNGELSTFRKPEQGEPTEVEMDEEEVKVEGQGQEIIESSSCRIVESQQEETQEPRNSETPAPGEEEFRRARAMVHQKIPDFRTDGLYLDLLGKSAEEGYAPALAKLGEYAMRRAAWVEAYYWMWRAQRSGMSNLESVLRGIRQCWITAGCPDEKENVHDLFDEERGSIGRALLGIAVSRDAAAAREFLRANHPEFL